MALLCSLMMTACVPQNYMLSQGYDTQKAGETLLKNYLDAKYTDYKLETPHVITGAKLGQQYFMGSYLTKSVGAEFVVDGKNYRITADTETETIYSEELKPAIKAFLAEEIKPYFDKYGFEADYAVDTVFVEYILVNHDVKNRKELVNTEVVLTNEFPVEITEEKVADFFDRELDGMDLTAIWIAYSGDAKPFPRELYEEFVADHPYMKSAIIRLMKLSEENLTAIQNGGWYNGNMEILEDTHYVAEEK